MRKRVLVCGLGNMGKAIVWCMNHLGFDVIAIDSNPNAARGNNPPRRFYDFYEVKNLKDIEQMITLSSPSVVISSLPYHQTKDVAKFCANKGYNYCDLGGRVDVSKEINDICGRLSTSKSHIFTDLGLAPGWINILAEHGCKSLYGKANEINEVKMMVGGLPSLPNNPPLNYEMSWSYDGLINEYKDDCDVIINGVKTKAKGMDGLELVETKSLGELEAFYTSGGASHTIDSMTKRNVKECSYKTLRYKGHCDIVKFLIRNVDLSADCMKEIFDKGCAKSGNTRVDDLVIMKVSVKARESSWEKELLIPSSGAFSAMQKATSFPISSVAKMMAENFFEKNAPQHRDYYDKIPIALSYKDVDYEEFMKNMNSLREAVKDADYERD
jgi:saccharopine dehydrogenase-like NADP-dependent oxidoreductase